MINIIIIIILIIIIVMFQYHGVKKLLLHSYNGWQKKTAIATHCEINFFSNKDTTKCVI